MNSNLAYQEPLREELINGRPVAMSPRPSFNHNRVASNIFRLFANRLDNGSCEAIADGTELHLDEENVFVPDMMVVCDRAKIKRNGVYGAPDLVVEVLSPGTARNDKVYKKERYGSCGVREYWIVAPEEKLVEVYRAGEDGLALHDIYTLAPDWMLEGMNDQERAEVVSQFRCSLYDDFEISLEEIFKGLLP